MPDLLAGAVGAPGDDDLIADTGLALYLFDACHIWPPFRGSPVLFASPPLSLLYNIYADMSIDGITIFEQIYLLELYIYLDIQT